VAKRRRVGNVLALAVFSVVIQRPMHPYEMASVLRARDKDQDMKIKWGSLYTVVRNMEKHGLLEAIENTRHGGRPERTVYRITDAGRAEFKDWVGELVSTPEQEYPRFGVALSVLGALTPDEATSLLRQRLDRMREQIVHQRESMAHHRRELPRLFLVEVEYDLAVREAELTWVSTLLEELTTGSFPGLAQWRRFHETGEVPPELAHITERGSTRD